MTDRSAPEPGRDEVFARAAANRRAIAGLAELLTPEELATASLCEGWTTQDVLGHLAMSLDLSFGGFLLAVARDLGRVGRTSSRLARVYGERPADELVAIVREHADDELAPPGIGPLGPFADTCIHLRDIALPLGLPDTAPLDDWRLVLGFLTTRQARTAGFVAAGRLDGLRLVATDLEGEPTWGERDGEGAEVSGPVESLVLAVSGRAVALPDLTGPGVAVLAARV